MGRAKYDRCRWWGKLWKLFLTKYGYMEYGYISTKLKMAKKIIKQKHQQQWFNNVENLMKSVLFLTVSMSNLRSLTNVSAFSHFLQFLQVIFTQIHYSSWLMDWLNWSIDWPVSGILSRVFDALWIWQSWPKSERNCKIRNMNGFRL